MKAGNAAGEKVSEKYQRGVRGARESKTEAVN